MWMSSPSSRQEAKFSKENWRRNPRPVPLHFGQYCFFSCRKLKQNLLHHCVMYVLYVSVYVCTYVCVCEYAYVYTYIYVFLCMHACMCECMYAYIHTYMCVDVSIHHWSYKTSVNPMRRSNAFHLDDFFGMLGNSFLTNPPCLFYPILWQVVILLPWW